jgi:hypothetical protein
MRGKGDDMGNIVCKYCGASVPSENINYDSLIARCKQCGAIFGVSSLIERPTPEPAPAPVIPEKTVLYSPANAQPLPLRPTGVTPMRREVPLPSSIAISQEGADLKINRVWFNWGSLFIIFFCVFWNGFMLFWNGMALSQGIWMMAIFGLLHTAIGVGVAYGTLATLLNSTTLRINPQTLTLTHGPLPWPGNMQVSPSEIKQLFSRQVVTYSRKGGRSITYEVRVVYHNTHEKVLVRGLREPNEALYIEQQIERALHIADETVTGEMSR